jgi:polyisoprenoid-binding protein YceI
MPATPPAARTLPRPDTRTAGDGAAAAAAPGRWVVDGASSTLQISVGVGFVATVRGRFTEVVGELVVAEPRAASSIRVEVASASLSSGSSHWDDVLRAAGLVDTQTCPTIGFTSTGLQAAGDGWTVHGTLRTARGTCPIRLQLHCRSESAARLRFEATGTIPSREATRLLSRPGVQRLLGRSMAVQLLVEAVPAD